MGRQFIQNYFCFAQILEEEELELEKRRKEEETMAKEEEKELTNADRIRHMTKNKLPVEFAYTENGVRKTSVDENKRMNEIDAINRNLRNWYANNEKCSK